MGAVDLLGQPGYAQELNSASSRWGPAILCWKVSDCGTDQQNVSFVQTIPDRKILDPTFSGIKESVQRD